jgi:hypothetical protein
VSADHRCVGMICARAREILGCWGEQRRG